MQICLSVQNPQTGYLTVAGTFVLLLCAFLSAYFGRIPNSNKPLTTNSIGSIIVPLQDCWKNRRVGGQSLPVVESESAIFK